MESCRGVSDDEGVGVLHGGGDGGDVMCDKIARGVARLAIRGAIDRALGRGLLGEPA